MNKPKSDIELFEYQKEVCCNCERQFDLTRGIFTKGCKLVDLYGMTNYPQIIKEDGICCFFKGKI